MDGYPEAIGHQRKDWYLQRQCKSAHRRFLLAIAVDLRATGRINNQQWTIPRTT